MSLISVFILIRFFIVTVLVVVVFSVQCSCMSSMYFDGDSICLEVRIPS